MELLHKELTDKILKAFYAVYNELGYGFLEKVYQNSFLEVGLLLNFGKKPEFIRKVYENKRK